MLHFSSKEKKIISSLEDFSAPGTFLYIAGLGGEGMSD